VKKEDENPRKNRKIQEGAHVPGLFCNWLDIACASHRRSGTSDSKVRGKGQVGKNNRKP
jgi:hypothetical protein